MRLVPILLSQKEELLLVQTALDVQLVLTSMVHVLNAMQVMDSREMLAMHADQVLFQLEATQLVKTVIQIALIVKITLVFALFVN